LDKFFEGGPEGPDGSTTFVQSGHSYFITYRHRPFISRQHPLAFIAHKHFVASRAIVSLRIECAEGTVLIYATSPHGVTTASRPAVNKMLNDINWRSAIGNWEMDPADGEV
jgi:hypothetical protein